MKRQNPTGSSPPAGAKPASTTSDSTSRPATSPPQSPPPSSPPLGPSDSRWEDDVEVRAMQRAFQRSRQRRQQQPQSNPSSSTAPPISQGRPLGPSDPRWEDQVELDALDRMFARRNQRRASNLSPPLTKELVGPPPPRGTQEWADWVEDRDLMGLGEAVKKRRSRRQSQPLIASSNGQPSMLRPRARAQRPQARSGAEEDRVPALAEAWAKRREKYLREHHPKTYRAWERSGYLKEHLAETGQEAVELTETLSTQMENAADLPTDYIERVKRLEAIPLQVREIVEQEVIYSPPS